jgi:hypothetical protein
VIATTTLLAHLAKSGFKLNTPDLADTKLSVPSILSPTLELVFPFFSFYSTVQTTLAPVNSWWYSQAQSFNAGSTVDIIVLGPGVWDVMLKMDLEEQGAVSDATSTCDVTYFANDGTGVTINLGRLTNKQGLDQSQMLKWRQLVTSDQTYQFRLVRVAGLGTALNIARIQIRASRLF